MQTRSNWIYKLLQGDYEDAHSYTEVRKRRRRSRRLTNLDGRPVVKEEVEDTEDVEVIVEIEEDVKVEVKVEEASKKSSQEITSLEGGNDVCKGCWKCQVCNIKYLVHEDKCRYCGEIQKIEVWRCTRCLRGAKYECGGRV